MADRIETHSKAITAHLQMSIVSRIEGDDLAFSVESLR
ncbi:unnamed protein product, partial [marine sediment metagenome]